MKLKRFRVILFVLIAFGIVKYRQFLAESVIKIFENISVFPLVFALGLMAVFGRFARWSFFIHSLDYQISLWDQFKIYFSGFATIPSMVKFSDSLRLVYMKDYGVELVDGIAVYGMERLADIIVTSLLFLIVVGQLSGLAGSLGFLALLWVLLKTRRLWLAKLERFEKFRRLEQYLDAFVYDMKNFRRPAPVVIIAMATVGIYVLELVALSSAVGIIAGKVLPAFLVGKLLITTMPTPGALGFYEAGVSGILAGFVGGSAALAAVMIYRFVVLWLPVILGQISVALMSY